MDFLAFLPIPPCVSACIGIGAAPAPARGQDSRGFFAESRGNPGITGHRRGIGGAAATARPAPAPGIAPAATEALAPADPGAARFGAPVSFRCVPTRLPILVPVWDRVSQIEAPTRNMRAAPGNFDHIHYARVRIFKR